jgi:tetratricopeptide (TPR) repeat protein
LYAKALYQALCRIVIVAVCMFAVWRSARIAVADWIASAGTGEGYERALRLVPDNSDLLMRAAIYRIDNGDTSPSLDGDLQRAVSLNPLDPAPLIALGLKEEFAENYARAESYLARAADLDHQFRPAWTLANYYLRRNQPDKSWPLIQRVLNLDPLGFDPAPVFNLCWTLTNDSGKILSLIPRHGKRPIEYLQFLINTHRTDAALALWPIAVAGAESSDTEILTGFADSLAASDRIANAVSVWNELVNRGILHSGHLDPARSVSIADPEFRYIPSSASVKAFGWRLADNPGVFTSKISTGLSFELNGDEPQTFEALSTFAAVIPSTRYRLRWKSDGSKLNSPRDSGFAFQVVEQPGEAAIQCQPLLSSDTCDFVTPVNIHKARIGLHYTRAPGTIRPSGVLQISAVRLEFAR